MNIIDDKNTNKLANDLEINPDQEKISFSQHEEDRIKELISDGYIDEIVKVFDLDKIKPELADKIIDDLKKDIFENRPVFDLNYTTRLEEILLVNNITREMLWNENDHNISHTQERIINEIVFNNDAYIYLSRDFLPEPNYKFDASGTRLLSVEFPNDKLQSLIRNNSTDQSRIQNSLLFVNLFGLNYNKPSLEVIDYIIQSGVNNVAFYEVMNRSLPEVNGSILRFHINTLSNLPFVPDDTYTYLEKFSSSVFTTTPNLVKLGEFSKIIQRPSGHSFTFGPDTPPILTSPILNLREKEGEAFQLYSSGSLFRQIVDTFFDFSELEINYNFPNLSAFLEKVSNEIQSSSNQIHIFTNKDEETRILYEKMLSIPDVLDTALYLYLYDFCLSDDFSNLTQSKTGIKINDFYNKDGSYNEAKFLESYFLYQFYKQVDYFDYISNFNIDLFANKGDTPYYYEFFSVLNQDIINNFLFNEYNFKDNAIFFELFEAYVFQNLYEYKYKFSNTYIDDPFHSRAETLILKYETKALQTPRLTTTIKSERPLESIAQNIADSILRFSDSVNLVLKTDQSHKDLRVLVDVTQDERFKEIIENNFSFLNNNDKSFINFNMILIYNSFRYTEIPAFLMNRLGFSRKDASKILEMVDKKLAGYESFSVPLPKQDPTPYEILDINSSDKRPTFKINAKKSS